MSSFDQLIVDIEKNKEQCTLDIKARKAALDVQYECN